MLRLRRSRLLALTTAWALIAFSLCVFSACTDTDSQAELPQSQQQADQIQPQSDEPVQSVESEADEFDQPEQAVQPDAAADGQQANAAQPGAADETQQGQQSQSEPQTPGYGAADPYGGSEDEGEAEDVSLPIPPVRAWLVEGIALTPSVPAERDEYGWSAVIEGDVIAVGAPYHDVMGENTGAVFIFERVGGEWAETAYILPPFPDPLGWFGRWLAIDDGRIVIGAPYEDGEQLDGSRIDDSGVAYVYEKVNGVWSRTGTIVPDVPSAGASFGWSVAISADRVAVAAWEDTTLGVKAGSVTIFREYKGLWLVEAVIRPSEPSERLMFGRDIALQDNVLVVGAPGDDTIAEDAGAVYVWSFYDDDWYFTAKLVAPDGDAGDALGSQVALQSPWLASGAYDHDDPYWSGGATYVWKLGNIWALHTKLGTSDMQPGDWFGYSLDIQGERMVVGAPHRAHPESGTYRSGAAYAFELVNDEWLEVGVLGPVDAVAAGERAEFGWVTEIDGTTAVVGAWLADTEAGEDAGSAAVYELPTSAERE